MTKKIFLLLVLSFIITGCARLSKKDSEIQSLKSQINILETQLKEKDQEIQELRTALERDRTSSSRREVYVTKIQRPTVKQIQLALKNAGFDPGPIDGRMGKKTRQAIKDFQKANGLTPDGRVGKNTWALLKKYLR